MQKSQKYRVLGLMSGTSLDGLDIAFVTFEKKEKWHFEIGPCETISYPEKWLDRLSSLPHKSKEIIQATDLDYGRYLGQAVNSFLSQHNLEIDFIASHGHTIFHQPEKKYTLQIGDGQSLADTCLQTVICDFRTLDVSLGGQGAPLVPIGDRLLFDSYDYCLNLGGFSNLSYEEDGKRIAYDICPVNIVLNELAQRLDLAYDKDGLAARSGRLNTELLQDLNKLTYYQARPPKSLGREWIETHINPLLTKHTDEVNNLLHTFTEHAAQQIGRSLKEGKCLVTGGGAFNGYLLERMKHYSQAELVLPTSDIIDFKEALVFAFLGLLRWRKEDNCLMSVTGAERDSSGGQIFTP
jgi:anhydro-N-acetylmuramic acid kinase